MYYIYVLKSKKDNKHYIGFANDVSARLHEHNSGKVRSTKNRIPFEIIYTEEYENQKDAIIREKYLKTGSGREHLKRKLKNLALVAQLDRATVS